MPTTTSPRRTSTSSSTWGTSSTSPPRASSRGSAPTTTPAGDGTPERARPGQDLEDYRYIYRQYRSNEFLQEAIESHTLIAGWDDHEMVNDVYWDYRADAPAGDHPRGDDPEFMTRGRRRRLTEPLLSWLVPAMNPHIEFFDSHHWGYSVVAFTPEDCTYVGYAVDKTIDSAEAERGILVAYRVPEGEHELEEVTDEYRS